MKGILLRIVTSSITFLIGTSFTLLPPPRPEPAQVQESLVVASRPADTPPRAMSSAGKTLVAAGQSVGYLFLGDSRDRAVEIFGKPDTEYDYDTKTSLNCGRKHELRFLEIYDKHNPFHFDYGNGLWVILAQGRITHFKIQSDKFATKEGLRVDSTPASVRKAYPNIRTFVELNTADKFAGYRNLIFWVDSAKGIAFEFYFNRRLKQRRVAYIHVFEPQTEFLPAGCVYLETQGWQEIEPFALEEPNGLQKQWEREN